MSRRKSSQAGASAIQSLLTDAVREHQAGRLDEAKKHYLDVLAIDVRHAKSLYGLGLIGLQTGNHEAAGKMLQRAISIDGDESAYHSVLGAVLLAQHKRDEAVVAYRRVLALSPDNEEAHFNLGNIFLDQRNFAQAKLHYERALALKPGSAEIHNNLGMLLVNEGKPDEAQRRYEQALALKPEFAEAHNNLGNLFWSQEKFQDAKFHYERALALNPDFAEAHNNLGNILRELGELDAAQAHYERTLALRPDFAEAHNNLGIVHRNSGKYDEAIASCARAIALRPTFLEALSNMGNMLCDDGKPEEAAVFYERGIALKPDYAEAHNHLGVSYRDRGMLSEAAACHGRALALKPDYAEAYNNLGVVFREAGRLEEAAACQERALALKPDYVDAHINLGNTLRSQGRPRDAMEQYGRALALKPDHAEALWNRSLIELLLGDFAAGWRDYEVRRKLRRNAPRSFPQPTWCGQPLDGTPILLHAEQGLGDTIQFLRYVPMVQAAGGRVIVDVPGSLLRIAAQLPEVVVVPAGEPLPHFDWQCPLMSLPLAFGTTVDSIRAQVPYLRVPDEAQRSAQSISWTGDSLRVGLVWSGNPKYIDDRNRSIPTSCFEALFRMPGVRFFSLQLGPAASQLAGVGASVVDLQSSIRDLADTAALIANLDLVLTVDTAVAHLAGALGKPTWVLLPFAPDWRWLLERDDSPWYPTVRLFRQPAPGDWPSVLERVRVSLSERVSSGLPRG